ncbi:AAA family ATPase [Paenibacillus sp. J2TS4]|uniref:AAA family ATPase n=1 Tax=Paenibacillus sp. J2TS4 TaxID=2807194 RepID=UPI001B1A44B7|nr:AAA family ATPase [Paenibacillus sp. J2TS4]GIP32674.1 hypothetical protein J2TS4_18840 [Paenibacillus sp. J2TS4]
MEKWLIAILDDDQMYVNILLNYVRTSEYRSKVIVKSFTEPGMLEQADDSFDLILINPELSASGLPSTIPVAKLVDEITVPDDSALEVYRYQPLNQLFSRLIAYMLDKPAPGRLTGNENGRTRVLSVYSAVGGCGKTVLAANLATMLAFRGAKVFYLSLEAARSAPIFPTDREKRPFERLLYYLQADSPYARSKLEQYKSIDPESKVEYVDPCESLQEMEEMTEEDARKLLSLLRQSDYDYVIVDCDSERHARIWAALAASDRILWLVEDDLNHLTKTKAIYNHFCEKIGPLAVDVSFVLNKYTGSIVNDIGSFGYVLFGQLPFVFDWQNVHSASQLLSDSTYRAQLMRWFRKLEPEVREEAVSC